MLSRAFTKPRRSFKDSDHESRSVSIKDEYDDCIVGFMDDLPLISCGGSGTQMTLREILRASVGVIGESRLGMTEKIVLLKGEVCALNRFRRVIVGKSEFRRRVERLAQVCSQCEFLVPVTAYLYSKRTKFVVCHYYPMGSLADLLAGARDRGHTALSWNQRLVVILHVAEAVAFIHKQFPNENFHGNIKSSNVMINVDFTARLSDYGFTRLAEPVDVTGTCREKPHPRLENFYEENSDKKDDIYDFGMVLLDILGGIRAPGLRKCIVEKKDRIMEGSIEFFEVPVEGKERKQALQVLDIALACTNKLQEARPSVDQILLFLNDVVSNR